MSQRHETPVESGQILESATELPAANETRGVVPARLFVGVIVLICAEVLSERRRASTFHQSNSAS